jgi:hypothetical protein
MAHGTWSKRGIAAAMAALTLAACAAEDGTPGPEGPQGAAGPVGPPALPFLWRGAWEGGTAYAQRDVVQFGGSSWVATAASTGHARRRRGVGARGGGRPARRDGRGGPAGDPG